MNPNDLVPKGSNSFICEKCDYTSSRKSQYDRHLITAKHLNPNKILNKLVEKVPIIPSFDCVCGKIYKHQSSLCNHTKICTEKMKFNDAIQLNSNNQNNQNNNNVIIEILKQNNTILLENQEFKELFLEQKNDFKEMILEKPSNENNNSLIVELLKQNQDFKDLMIEQNKYMMEQSKQMMELAKNAGNTTNNTTNKFNMQIFLNETCKDAMSITEFVNSLVLTFKDLEDLGRYGYTQGITNIFTRGLQATEVSKRPIHCSDMKRLIIYINDTNGWEKDNSSQEKVIQLIRKIAGKNLRQATEWMRINHSMIHGPDSYEQRQYLKMISQWFGGTDEENVKIYNKIIRNIAPQCYIDKYPALK